MKIKNDSIRIAKRLQSLVFEAGKIALALVDKSHPAFKADKSIVTDADIKIAHLIHARLRDFLSSGEHILIDEEDPRKIDFLNEQALRKAKYVWTVDPIDGTRNYSNGMPTYAISIGVFKNLKPWMGAVYFPAFKELFFCDGRKSFFIQNAFGKNEARSLIRPKSQKITSQSLFLLIDNFFKEFDWDPKDCRTLSQACATIDLCWPSIGRGVGSIIKCSLWDFAGSWPIAKSAGLDIRSLKTGKVMNKLSAEDYRRDIPWRLKEHYLISSKRNFLVLKNKIKSKE